MRPIFTWHRLYFILTLIGCLILHSQRLHGLANDAVALGSLFLLGLVAGQGDDLDTWGQK